MNSEPNISPAVSAAVSPAKNSGEILYLDCAASAPVFSELLNPGPEWVDKFCANPSARHRLGLESAELLSRERCRAAELLGCRPEQVSFCSGATEANNLALYNRLLPQLLSAKSRHDLSGSITAAHSELDHPSGIQPLRRLKPYGLQLQRIALSSTGELLLGRYLEKQLAVRSSANLLCLITTLDGESGRKQDLSALAAEIQNAQEHRRAAGLPPVYIHADISQHLAAEASVPQLARLGMLLQNSFDSIALSGQKIGAGRGCSILLQRNLPKWSLSQGGGQEAGQRAGTENLYSIRALVRALELQAAQYQAQLQRSAAFLELLAGYPQIRLQPTYRSQYPALFSPFIFSIAAPPLPAEVLQRLLSEHGYMVGTGSACSSKTAKDRAEKLLAQGYDRELLPSIMRISFGNGASHPGTEQLRGFLDCLHSLQQRYA
ncbi:aminotransferase class V-fold PLP-dependent enzyme [Candidatus Haliotispira prima]|uniref:Aminotransferase class V-fold PLP-dependent enzyme n=1 Tax=Candidatus Haliotispira prima TaxID=3034016 RepID=A0ABY8MLY8_9SPIO|nr:aminotransferase class V-fold PLP-dependent enzyme [Candidatus Haliotispira prima]